MKPIFGLDITDSKDNDVFNGEEFITKTVSKEKYDEYTMLQERLDNTVASSKQPLWLRIIKAICGIYALLCAVAIVRAGIGTAYKNAPAIVISAAACAVIWVVLHIIALRQEKQVLEEENAVGQLEKIEFGMKAMYDELDVPSIAVSVDVLMFRYKVKDGEICPKTVGFQSTPYMNLDAMVYVQDDCLCIADLEKVYSFKLSEIKGIKTVNRRISISNWNKEEHPMKGEYSQYKMTVNNMGEVFFKPYHILEIEHDGELYGLYFPCYELDTFELLTGHTAEE